jgi:hypothetical protein
MVARGVLLFALALAVPAPAGAEPPVAFDQKDGRLQIQIDGKPFATYVWKDDKVRRPYFTHLHAPNGVRVTRTHPPVAGTDLTDHADMHPGLWLAFGDLGGVDFWRNKGTVEHVAFVEKPTATKDGGTFAVRNRYKAGDKTVCEEVCRISITVKKDVYLIDWASEFTGTADFHFGDQEEMGLGVRVATPLTVKNGGRIVNSGGMENEKGVWGQPADWCDYRGTVGGKKAGVAILAHPDNFRRPWFHARDYGLLVANPFGRRAFTKGEASKVTVKAGEPFRLRFGVLVHAGAADVKAAYDEWRDSPAGHALLDLPGSGTDPEKIDYGKLPVVPVKHAVVSAGEGEWKFRLHSYLVRHGGKFWCMWSHGPEVEDLPTQHVRYATSEDGLKWSEPKVLIPPPKEPYAYIARGFWVRDGELLALAAHYKGKGAFGIDKELKLEAFAYDPKAGAWKFKGVVFEDAINNFPPEELPGGGWMMTRRDSRFNVYALIGGTDGIDRWESVRVVDRLKAVRETKFSPDEPIWWAQPDRSLVALFRDNGGSNRLWRSTSADRGKTWTPPARTNFPNATSKLFSLRTSGGTRVLISNANPKVGRRELHVSASSDGESFTRSARLDVPSPKPATLQYPHAVEHYGHLYVSFSRNKTAIEVVRVRLADVELPGPRK